MASPAKQVLRRSDFPKVLESAWLSNFPVAALWYNSATGHGQMFWKGIDRSGIDGKIHAVHMLSILRGIRLDSGEWIEAGEKVDSTERQQILRLAVSG